MISPFEQHALMLLLLIILAAAVVFDIRTHKIPNLLVYPSMLAAISYYTFIYGLKGFAFSAGGLFTGIALLLLPYLMGGMGAGDAKLMGAVGACLGVQKTITVFLFIAVMGCLYALIALIVYRRRFKGYLLQLWLTAKTVFLTRKYIPVESSQAAAARPRVYYGVAIAAGTVLYVCMEITGFKVLI